MTAFPVAVQIVLPLALLLWLALLPAAGIVGFAAQPDVMTDHPAVPASV